MNDKYTRRGHSRLVFDGAAMARAFRPTLLIIILMCAAPIFAQCSVSATLAQATDPGYDGPALHIVVASGAVGNGAQLTIFREGVDVSRLSRGGYGPLDWTFPLGCTLQPDTYTYKIVGFCSSLDADGNLTSTSSPVTTGGFVVPAESPKLSVDILDVPAGSPNVKISWTFPPSAAGPRQIRLVGMGLGLNSVGFSGTWTVKLQPGSYAVTAGWCVVLNSGYGFTLPFQVTAAPPASPPKFEFEYDERQPPEKLLLHKYMATDVSGPFSGYWSSYQVQNVSPTSPPQFRVPGVLKQGQTPVVSTIYARVIDPPDTAAYVPQQLRVQNDNRDQAHPKGTLFYYDAQGTRIDQNANGVLQMTTNSSGITGKAEMYLEASNDVAGENYQVEVSLDPNFSCATSGTGGADVCPKSVVVATWKRVYIEQHSMFRKGVFLAQSAPAGSHEIIVREEAPGQPPPFVPGSTIRLIAGEPGMHMEDVLIDPNPIDPVTHAALNPIDNLQNGTYRIRLLAQNGLSYDYLGTPSTAPNPFAGDAAGVPGANFVADTTLIRDYFKDMFVDVQFLSNQLTDLPHIPVMDRPPLGDRERSILAGRFSEHRDDNVFHVMGDDQDFTNAAIVVTPQGRFQQCGVNFGFTSPGRANASHVFVGAIEAAVRGPVAPCTFALRLAGHSAVGLNRAGTAHELTHQWFVNHDSQYPQSTQKPGHCSSPSASAPPANSGDMCLMHKDWPLLVPNFSQIDTPRLGLHWLAGGADSEYIQIRTHGEPVTQ